MNWINYTFDWCVRLLEQTAYLLGLTYQEINVWLFCIILPIILLIMTIQIIMLKIKVNSLKSLDLSVIQRG